MSDQAYSSETLLTLYGEAAAYLALLEAEKAHIIDALIPQHIRDQIAAVEAELEPAFTASKATLDNLKALVVTQVKDEQKSVKAGGYHAVFIPGKETWDEKALEGFAAAHPEILKLKKAAGPGMVQLRIAK